MPLAAAAADGRHIDAADDFSPLRFDADDTISRCRFHTARYAAVR